jgi:hypothetical protein
VKPVDRLIHYQHLLNYLEGLEAVDQGQVKLARYNVNGIIRDWYIRHAFELKPNLEPL